MSVVNFPTTNSRGAPVFETPVLTYHDLAIDEPLQLLFTLVDHLGLQVVRTNATKHGDTQLILKPQE